MTASALIEQARSLADLQNSKAITYDDEKNSINTAYRLIYNKISESDDDYYLKTFTYPSITQYAISMPYNYMIPLPVDFYKLRSVSYNINGKWTPMGKMPLNVRNQETSIPYYRLQNNNLWVISNEGGAIDISYYPPPATITLPDYSTTFDGWLSITEDIYLHNTISDANHLYTATGSVITEKVYNKSLLTTIYSGVDNISYPLYYKGLLFFIEGVGIKYKDVNSLFTGTAVALAANQPFSIENDYIYYSDGTDQRRAQFLGTSDNLVLAGHPTRICVSVANDRYVEDGKLYVNDVIVDDATYCNNAGFYNKGDDVFYDLVLYKANTAVGSWWNERMLATDKLDNTIKTYSTVVDTEFDYPTTVLFEILSYQAASDFKRKYDTASPELDAKLGQLWDSWLNSTIKRDVYKTERIQNVYPTGWEY